MDETTTTPSADESVVQTQPNEQTQEVAEQPQKPTAEESNDLPKPSNDDNLEWLKNKGIDPTSPEAVTAIAEKWREAERGMHAKTQKASELERNISNANQQQITEAAANGTDAAELALARVAALEVQNSVNNFFLNNPDAKQHEEAMVKIISERPEIGYMVRTGNLGIQDLYAMTVGSNIDSIKAQGGQQALQQLANKQTATAVQGAATTSALTPQKGDRLMDLWAS